MQGIAIFAEEGVRASAAGQKVAAPVLPALCGMALSEKKPLYCLDFWFFLSRKRTKDPAPSG